MEERGIPMKKYCKPVIKKETDPKKVVQVLAKQDV